MTGPGFECCENRSSSFEFHDPHLSPERHATSFLQELATSTPPKGCYGVSGTETNRREITGASTVERTATFGGRTCERPTLRMAGTWLWVHCSWCWCPSLMGFLVGGIPSSPWETCDFYHAPTASIWCWAKWCKCIHIFWIIFNQPWSTQLCFPFDFCHHSLTSTQMPTIGKKKVFASTTLRFISSIVFGFRNLRESHKILVP